MMAAVKEFTAFFYLREELMDLPLLFKALILGVVEGITEFLPVSSTGHLILVGDLLDFNTEEGKLFEIVIQCGAIFAIVWEYRARLASVVAKLPTDPQARRFALNLLVAFLPIAILGLLFGRTIKEVLFKPVSMQSLFDAIAVLVVGRDGAATIIS